ncbi:response regulator [Gallionella capsiferriformans]|uniref:Two component transcriptional regulator, LuxR family n=1 Tax=Gallionella capsiferriformans (strain ES-2) TaxID=395494 RepID=D9SF34_GALCS|nr:response regulator transcription factor [Gallionella capsiferriformans]ADL55131.1 two component transcriptional regulator, LuxR family [Gallionella capsiferriformans ES-2]
MIQILVVDDHALIRKGLKQLLEDTPDLKITGEASSGTEAISMLRAAPFDLMLLDINLPDKHGIEVLKQFKSEQPQLKIIILSMYPEDQYGVRALKAGAMGYINKQSASDVLIKAIRHVLSGKKYISEILAEQLLNNLIGESQELMHQNLSNREYQTLCLMASGKTLSEISQIMALSPKTVSVYRSRMLAKMTFTNNAEAIHYAITHRLVELQD